MESTIKKIWIPSTQTKVVVIDGEIYIKDEMIMNLKNIPQENKFFNKKEEDISNPVFGI